MDEAKRNSVRAFRQLIITLYNTRNRPFGSASLIITLKARLEAGVGGRRNRAELLLDAFADVEGFDEVGDDLVIDACSRAGKRLQCLVRIRIIFPAQDGLDSLGHHSPVSVKVCTDCAFVKNQSNDVTEAT